MARGNMLTPFGSWVFDTVGGIENALTRAEDRAVGAASLVRNSEVKETENGIEARFSLPGFTADEVDVSIDGQMLKVEAHREGEEEEESRRFAWSSGVTRTIALHKDADTEKVEATLKDGLLTLFVPFVDEPEPTKISVKTQ